MPYLSFNGPGAKLTLQPIHSTRWSLLGGLLPRTGRLATNCNTEASYLPTTSPSTLTLCLASHIQPLCWNSCQGSTLPTTAGVSTCSELNVYKRPPTASPWRQCWVAVYTDRSLEYLVNVLTAVMPRRWLCAMDCSCLYLPFLLRDRCIRVARAWTKHCVAQR